MKFALIGAAALAAAAFATIRTQIARTSVRAIRIPTAATIAATGRTATRSWSIVGTVTTGRTADSGSRSGRFPAASESARRTTKRAGLLRGDHQRFEVDTQRLGNAFAVGRIGLGAVGDMPLLDMPRRRTDLARGVVEQCLLLSRIHLAE
jgi:hypothetical protein